jgi:hypothetical protein
MRVAEHFNPWTATDAAGRRSSMFADVSLNMSISNRLWWSSGRAI